MLGAFLKRAADGLQGQMAKIKNKDFAEAVMYGCAYIACADGEVEPAEKAKMARYIERSDLLAAFDRSWLIQVFNKAVEEFEFDPKMGADAALKEIGQVSDPEQKNLVMRVCVAIAGSDGQIEPQEVEALRQIARTLGLDPATYLD